MRAIGLSGNELNAYALIYGFSQDGVSTFNGSIEYIREWLGCSRQTVFNVLKRLSDLGLLHKENVDFNGTTFCRYTAIRPEVQNLDGGSLKIRPNNIDYSIEDNIEHTPTQDINILQILDIDEAWRFNNSVRLSVVERLSRYLADNTRLGTFAQLQPIVGTAMMEGIAPDHIYHSAMDARSLTDFAATTLGGG